MPGLADMAIPASGETVNNQTISGRLETLTIAPTMGDPATETTTANPPLENAPINPLMGDPATETVTANPPLENTTINTSLGEPDTTAYPTTL
tara:strand:- start:219 stop:497 length:279 start_codon:yes stop_codon:yes gene_type:complete